MTQDDRVEMFEYLDGLRESGVTNMFGAGPYLAEAFRNVISDDEARAILNCPSQARSPESLARWRYFFLRRSPGGKRH